MPSLRAKAKRATTTTATMKTCLSWTCPVAAVASARRKPLALSLIRARPRGEAARLFLLVAQALASTSRAPARCPTRRSSAPATSHRGAAVAGVGQAVPRRRDEGGLGAVAVLAERFHALLHLAARVGSRASPRARREPSVASRGRERVLPPFNFAATRAASAVRLAAPDRGPRVRPGAASWTPARSCSAVQSPVSENRRAVIRNQIRDRCKVIRSTYSYGRVSLLR